MNWNEVVSELRRRASAQEELVRDPYKHQSIKQASATVAAVLSALADAFEKGAK
jgi:hypothetical protein